MHVSSSKEVSLGWAWPNQRDFQRGKVPKVTSADLGDSKQPLVSCIWEPHGRELLGDLQELRGRPG